MEGVASLAVPLVAEAGDRADLVRRQTRIALGFPDSMRPPRMTPFAVLLLAVAASLVAPSARRPSPGRRSRSTASNAGGRTFNRPNVGTRRRLSGKIVRLFEPAVLRRRQCHLPYPERAGGELQRRDLPLSRRFDPSCRSPTWWRRATTHADRRLLRDPFGRAPLNQNYYLVTSGGEPGTTGNFTSLVACAGANKDSGGRRHAARQRRPLRRAQERPLPGERHLAELPGPVRERHLRAARLGGDRRPLVLQSGRTSKS